MVQVIMNSVESILSFIKKIFFRGLPWAQIAFLFFICFLFTFF